ncbi:glycoside hydrolase domain-containing protein, partial [Bacteroidota bacterium]
SAVVRPAPAMFPDYLMSERKIDIKEKSYQAVWLTISIPEDAEAGRYYSMVTVKSVQGERTLPVSLMVYPLTMPSERHLKIAVRYSVNRMEQYHGVKERYSDEWFDMLKVYADNMAAHRQNVIQASMSTIGISRNREGELEFDFTRFDQIVQVFMNTGKMDFIETGLGLTKFGEGDWFSTEIVLRDIPVKDAEKGETITMAGKDVVPFLLPAFENHLRRKGWLSRTFIAVRNEVSLHNAIPYAEMSAYFHRLAPDLKQIESLETTMFGGVDIPGPKLDHLATWYDSFREAQRNGTEICYYIVGIYQGSRYPNKTIDVPVMDSRIMPWLNYKYNLSGIKHWGWNSWTDDPYKEVGMHLGDGWHVYPTQGGVLNSLRWEQMRNGIQDYEYFHMLGEKVQSLKDSLGSRFAWIDPMQRGREIAGQVVFNFADRTDNPQVLYHAKQELIGELLDFDTSPRIYVQTNPEENSTLTSHSTVEVFGWTGPGTRIVVNGLELPVSKEGMFLEQFLMNEIDNLIRVQATGPEGSKEIIRMFKIR